MHPCSPLLLKSLRKHLNSLMLLQIVPAVHVTQSADMHSKDRQSLYFDDPLPSPPDLQAPNLQPNSTHLAALAA